MEARNRTV
jgi:hypothetical protein